MDLTAIGIILGLIGTLTYVVVRFVRDRSFNLVASILIFLAFFAIPGGCALIKAALIGDITALPSTWRKHIAIAGVVVLGLLLQFLINTFRKIWTKSAKGIEASDLTNIVDANE